MATADELARLQAAVPLAQASQRNYGVPASITLAQWALESGWGTSGLSTKANNFFGIKASHLANPSAYISMPTYEFEEGKKVVIEALFEKFPSPGACFDAHAWLLSNAPRYKFAMEYASDPGEFASELQAAGYSTSPTYASSLMELITEHNLTQYDVTPPPAQSVAA